MATGIDYGMGQTNIDKATGIRYGVIHHGDVGEAWYDQSEAYYGEPHCPDCGDEATSYDSDTHEGFADAWCNDYACERCGCAIPSDDAFGDEPISHTYDADGYLAEQGDHDIFVTRSPYYTYAPFCSPCAPGAGYLGNAIERHEQSVGVVEDQSDLNAFGVKTYCFGHDWFEDGKAPYRVFRVSDDTEVEPDAR